MKNQIEHTYVCNVCQETYNGYERKWTCPICGNADTFECIDDYEDYDDDYMEEDYN